MVAKNKLRDAGLTLSCHLGDLLAENSDLSTALLPLRCNTRIRAIELGTGTGMVGISLAQTMKAANVVLTDLPEARDIVERNLRHIETTDGSSLRFQELDWAKDLPPDLSSAHAPFNLVLAADCIYNSDSRWVCAL